MWSASALCGANLVAAFFLLPESRHASGTQATLGTMGGVPPRDA